MAPNVLFFTGAPLSSSLNWDSDLLLEEFSSSIARFCGLSQDHVPAPPSTPSQAYASWRSSRLAREHLPTGHSQVHAWSDEFKGNAAFFSVSHPSFSFAESLEGSSIYQVEENSSTCESVEDIISQFYEESFAVHEDLPSSQIPVPSFENRLLLSDTEGESTTYSTTSFATSSDISLNSRSVMASENKVPVPIAGQISGLEHIPNAAYLQSIQPQTMTVNVIVGIISISPPRSIQTRRGAVVEIVELLVGDETRSGFGINCWLPPSKTSDKTVGQPDLRSSLNILRPQDIILVKNLALSNFNRKVYGQSIRREMTKVALLFRNRIDREDMGGCYGAEDFKEAIGTNMHPQVAKTLRVKEWVLRFVGPGPGAIGRTRKGELGIVKEVLPPDTQ